MSYSVQVFSEAIFFKQENDFFVLRSSKIGHGFATNRKVGFD